MKTRRHISPRFGFRWLATLLVLGSVFALHDGQIVRSQSGQEGKQEQTQRKANTQTDDYLTSRPMPAAPAAKSMAVGAAIETKSGQRQRVQLPDGSMLFVNELTQAKLEAPNRLALARGEVYVELAERNKKTNPFVVQTHWKRIQGKQSSFGVRAQKGGTGVLVVRGDVEVSGLKKPLRSGQLLPAEKKEPMPAPRPSQLLNWTRDLMTAAEANLVPDSQYSGGSLIAVDPNGQETKLTLRKYHMDVHIEDGFARTTIDQTYFNHENWQMEGTFYFPLPPDASLSRLAMYVDGNLMEGGMVVREYGAEVYETIRYLRKDPALLEWLDGSTFKMRVFPIASRKEKRIILSYTQKLPVLYGQMNYRFPAGHSLPAVRDWSLSVRVKDGAAMSWGSPSHDLQAQKDNGNLLLTAKQKNALFNKDVVLQITDPALADDTTGKVRFAETVHEGQRYFLVRLRPDLLRPDSQQNLAATEPKNWLFLFETSGDRDPLLARVQIEIIRHLLHHANPQDTFNILAANTRVHMLGKEPLPVTPENITTAINYLEKSHLIGALDLNQAFAEAGRSRLDTSTFLVHVGSGIPAMGERRLDILSKKFPKNVRYIGVGVGKRWNRSLMKAAAEQTGGYFTQINPDEAISWRAFELFSTLQTLGPNHLRRVEVTGFVPALEGKNPPRFLHFNQMLTQGEELAAVIRLDEKTELPPAVEVRFGDGQTKKLPIRNVTKKADYLPRQWARLEIESLLNKNPAKHKDDIIALSKAMYVMTPYTSLLVLENEDMYTQYKVDRGRKDHWAMYPAPRKIAVVHEPDPNAGQIKGRKKAAEVLKTVVVRERPQLLYSAPINRLLRKVEDALADAKGDAFLTGVLNKMRKKLRAANVSRHELRFIEDMMRPMGVAVDETTAGFYFSGGIVTSAPLAGAYFGKSAATRKRLLSDGDVRLLPIEAVDRAKMQAAINAEWARFGSAKNSKFSQIRNVLDKPLATGGVAGINFSTSGGEWNRFWSPDGLSGSTFERIHGNISPDDRGVVVRALLKKIVATDYATDSDQMYRVVSQLNGKPGMTASLLYRRPGYSGSDAIFYNLLAYAPGMNTSLADMLAVLDKEAIQYRLPKRGKIDAAARALIAKARKMGWQKLTVKDDTANFTILFDGRGRFAYERTLPPGIREKVMCDGKTMLHLYPQLYLGARREVSRFHRAAIAADLPWLVQPVEELARSADVKMIGNDTVAIVPHVAERSQTEFGNQKREKAKVTYQIHFVFARDGRLAERRLVEMPKGKTLMRQVLGADGTVKLVDSKGKEHVVLSGTLVAAEEPALSLGETGKRREGQASAKRKPGDDLVILELPYRSREFVLKKYKLEKTALPNLTFADARRLLAAAVAAGETAQAQQIFQQALHARNQRQLGYYVLLASCGANLDAQNLNVLEEHPDAPLAQYLALHTSPVLRQHASQWAVGAVQWKVPVLKHLATTHALYQRWQSNQVEKWSAARKTMERKKALAYVRDNKDSAFGWIMLCLLQDKAGKDKAFYRDLAEHFKLFADPSSLGYSARYEQARCLWKAGAQKEARAAFEKLYADALKDGYLPTLDSDFRQALLGDSKMPDAWSKLLRQTAKKLIADKNRPAILALASQCWQLEDVPVANQLLALALQNIKNGKERAFMKLAAVQFYRQSSQLPEAAQMLKTLLDDKEYSKYPSLWRLASTIAADRSQKTQSLKDLEWALHLEYRKLPDIINLEQVRTDYAKVLGHYETLAEAMVALKIKPSQRFFDNVIRIADRWRSLDNDDTQACESAARILRTLGKENLAWDYLTTPLGERPNESQPWVNLAESMRLLGKLDLADRAFKAAYESEPTNAQILWDRTQNLRQSGKTVAARRLLQQIADGRWQPRFQGLVSQARQQLGS